MKRLSFLVVALLFVAGILFAETHIPGGNISGVFLASGSPYYVDGEVHIPTGSSLIIEPGCSLIFTDSVAFVVDSAALLRAVGTETDSIFFVPQDTAIGWEGIDLIKPAENCTITYCHIEGSNSSGIYIDSTSNIIISHSTITGNRTISSEYGGGIYCYGSDITISNNTITENDVSGIDCFNSENITISNNTITKNDGSGIYCCGSDSITISGNTITENDGGGIYCCGSDSITISNNTITENDGGGIDCWNSDNITISSNTITENDGSGIYCYWSYNIAISNNTIIGNSADYGGGIYLVVYHFYVSRAVIFNNIITNNSADSLGSQICAEVGDSTDSTFLFISHCDLDTADCYFDVGAGELIFGDGIINVNPFFADTLFHLSDSSRCIDAGVESVYVSFWDTVIYAPTIDFEGDIRPIGGGWDIGADESPYTAPPNNPPIITTCPDDTIMIEISDTTQWVYIDFNDPDGDEIFCTTFETPDGYEHWGEDSSYYWGFGGSGQIRYAFYPDTADTGLYHFAFSACDYALCDTCDFWVKVLLPSSDDSLLYILYPGWNLIGGLVETIPATYLTSSPGVYSSVFGYSREYSSYFIADSLRYRQGYWVFALDTVEIFGH
ncbi:right-handed parallel beta-helix repeat-containing protein [bacterium]|nr:right-handed parallel beta-helix repeat-containing protein [bacterium]